MLSHLLPISNDWLLSIVLFGLCWCAYYEWNEMMYGPTLPSISNNTNRIQQNKKQRRAARGRNGHGKVLEAPIRIGCVSRNVVHLDPISFSRYVPLNVYMPSEVDEVTENTVRSKRRLHSTVSEAILAASPLSHSFSAYAGKIVDDEVINEVLPSIEESSETAETSEKLEDTSRRSLQRVQSQRDTDTASAVSFYDKIMMNIPPECKPDSPAAEKMAKLFPELDRPDIVRFLIARKGDIDQASEMAKKAIGWHNEKFPLKRSMVAPALNTKCFFPFGRARDGSPVVYMRGALYDNAQASAEAFVLSAAHTIEWTLKQYPGEVNVTVVVHTTNVPGAPNKPSDMNFIKLFVQVLSDNYPERLRRLILWPFPWYGRAIWGVIKVFIDKRTQNKVLLLSSAGSKKDPLPKELKEFIDPAEVPVCCCGMNDRPIIDMCTTLDDTD